MIGLSFGISFLQQIVQQHVHPQLRFKFGHDFRKSQDYQLMIHDTANNFRKECNIQIHGITSLQKLKCDSIKNLTP